MTEGPLDQHQLKLHRERAARSGGDFFLHRRAVEEISARLEDEAAPVKNGLLLGCPNSEVARPLLADDRDWQFHDYRNGLDAITRLSPQSLDAIILIGELNVAADPRVSAFVLCQALRPGGRIFGAVPSKHALPRLRTALVEADRRRGGAHARFHPGFDGPALADLLSSAGFANVVIDVDRFSANYASLDRLVVDLRSSGCTGALRDRPAPLSKPSLETARQVFSDDRDRTTETYELLFFSAKRPD